MLVNLWRDSTNFVAPPFNYINGKRKQTLSYQYFTHNVHNHKSSRKLMTKK